MQRNSGFSRAGISQVPRAGKLIACKARNARGEGVGGHESLALWRCGPRVPLLRRLPCACLLLWSLLFCLLLRLWSVPLQAGRARRRRPGICHALRVVPKLLCRPLLNLAFQ